MALYTDPATGIRYDTSNPTTAAGSRSSPRGCGIGGEAHFILKQSKLFFSKHEGSPPHGMIDLARA